MNRWTFMYSDNGVRVWTDEQSQYGQFDVMSYEHFEQFKEIAKNYNWYLNEQYD